MKYINAIAGALLGLLFIMASSLVLFHLGSPNPMDPESPSAKFMAIFAPCGWLTFVKICEMLGGILVAIPKTRNWGLIILWPIILNIFAFHLLIVHGGIGGMHIAIAALAVYLLAVEFKSFLRLLK